jgi:hypothetical protein
MRDACLQKLPRFAPDRIAADYEQLFESLHCQDEKTA